METLFDSLDTTKPTPIENRDAVSRVPLFGYIGGKARQLKYILPHLPYRMKYIEPFGGSGAVLIAREASKIDVFNDLYSGVVCFYRCLRDKTKMQRLVERLELGVFSREEFDWCKETVDFVDEEVERAARWYYITKFSFNCKGGYLSRSTSGSPNCMKIANSLPFFPVIHERFANVQVEMQDAITCMQDYDSYDAVFYVDPPYIDATSKCYKFELTKEQHYALTDTIFRCKGYVAVSGYENPIYSNQKWDRVEKWKVNVSSKSNAYTETNKRMKFQSVDSGALSATECLWIKY